MKSNTAALPADKHWLYKLICLISLIAHLTCRQFSLSVQGWEFANAGFEYFMSLLRRNLFKKANEKAATSPFCLFLARLLHPPVKAMHYFTLIIPFYKHGYQSQCVWWCSSLKDTVRERQTVLWGYNTGSISLNVLPSFLLSFSFPLPTLKGTRKRILSEKICERKMPKDPLFKTSQRKVKSFMSFLIEPLVFRRSDKTITASFQEIVIDI